MTKQVFLAAAAFLFAVPFFVSAQTPEPAAPPAFMNDMKSAADFAKLTDAQKKEFAEYMKSRQAATTSQPAAKPTLLPGTVDCFDYYQFGSVQADFSSMLASTVPGATIGFTGKVKNDNTYPVVDGQVYVKIFRKGGDEKLIHQNGYALVDQFALPDTFNLPAKGEREASFTWKVPENAQAGDYQVSFFFETAKRYNLLGLSFTDDVTGNQANFSVKNSHEAGIVAFDKNAVTKNGMPHYFAAFLTKYTKDEPVVIKTKLVNPRNETVVVPVSWKLYAWDSLREETLKDTKTELITLKPNETKELSYTAKPIDASVSYLVAETRDENSKSILDIRFARNGIEETRINFPSITDFPLKADTKTALFSCAHSTNESVVKDNILTLTLKDEQGKTIHTYKYQGDITGAMMGVKDLFTPTETYDRFSLTATLERQGKIVEEVTQSYACQDIDPNLCSKLKAGIVETAGAGRGALFAILGAVVLLLGLLVWKLWKERMGSRGRMVSFLFAMLVSGAMLLGGVPVAEAKSVMCSTSNGCMPGIPTLYSIPSAYESYGYGVFSGALASVSYEASIVDNVTGIILSDGAELSVGSVFKVVPKNRENTDISWFMSGYWEDSPFGYWTPKGQKDWPGDPFTVNYGNCSSLGCSKITPVSGNLADYDMKVLTCSGWDSLVHKDANCLGGGSTSSAAYSAFIAGNESKLAAYGAYIFGTATKSSEDGTEMVDYTRFYVTEPDISYIVTGPASCAGNICTVNGEGLITAQAVFQSTQGRFKFPGDSAVWGPYGPSEYSVGMFSLESSGFSYLTVPARTIPFTLTAVATNNNPTVPEVKGSADMTASAPTTGIVGSPVNIFLRATDPDTGDLLRFNIDWDNNGALELFPSTGWVASGVVQSASHTWLTTGARTVKLRTEDNRGGFSAWVTIPITINSAVNGVCGVADTATSGVTFAAAPLAGWCQDIAATPAVSGSGPWTWVCPGQNGGLPSPMCQADPSGFPPQLEICIDDSGTLVPVAAGDGDSYAIQQMAIGNDTTFKTFYDSNPNDCGGTAPVTGGTTWNAGINNPDNAVSFTSAGVLHANANGNETVEVSYNGQTITMNAKVACTPAAWSCDSFTSNVCTGQQTSTGLSVTDSCTVVHSCAGLNGTKICGTGGGWKEVAP
jgi:hypothetical protein